MLTWFGEQMESSQINKAIKSVWKKAKADGNPSSTILRKSAVSQVQTVTLSGEARENLADLMVQCSNGNEVLPSAGKEQISC